MPQRLAQVLSGILRAPRVTEGSFKDVDVEDDEFTVVYSTHQQPRIANDTIIMDRSLVTDSQVGFRVRVRV